MHVEQTLPDGVRAVARRRERPEADIQGILGAV
jgi:hypothetical protein